MPEQTITLGELNISGIKIGDAPVTKVLIGATLVYEEIQGIIQDCVIQNDGWTLAITLKDFQTGASYNPDPDGAPTIRLNVTSPGFDNAGNATTQTRQVVATKLKRLAYPDDANADEVQSGADVVASFALSEYIHPSDTVTISTTDGYATDTNGGGENAGVMTNAPVTNNSLLAYPKVIARWAYPHVGHYETGDFYVELVAFQAYAENGKPVAAVKFTASDGTNTSETTVTDMIVSDLVAGDQNAVLVYRGTIDTTGLNDGPVTVRAEVFPHVGDAASIRDTNDASDGFETYKVRLDKAQTYPRNYAYVSTTGSDGSGIASLTPATAQSSPFASVGAARTAIMAANGGSDSGGIIRLEDGNYNGFGTTSSAATTNEVWLTIEAVNAGQADIDPNNVGTNLGAGLIRIKDINITDINGSKIFVDGGEVAGKVVWLDHCTAIFPWNASIYKCPRVYVTGGSIDGDLIGFSSTTTTYMLVRGLRDFTSCQGYCVLGCLSTNAKVGPLNAFSAESSSNLVAAFNRFVDGTETAIVYKEPATDGLAVVQNVLEVQSGTQGLMGLFSDGTSVDSSNILVFHNTSIGQRFNFAYNDEFNPTHINWFMRGNNWATWNIKSDIFHHPTLGRDGSRINNWSVYNGVGLRDNVAREIGAGFPPEFNGLNTHNADTDGVANVVFTNAAGNDFSMSTKAECGNRIPAGKECLPFDLAGIARPNDGTGSAGAYQ